MGVTFAVEAIARVPRLLPFPHSRAPAEVTTVGANLNSLWLKVWTQAPGSLCLAELQGLLPSVVACPRVRVRAALRGSLYSAEAMCLKEEPGMGPITCVPSQSHRAWLLSLIPSCP